MSPDHQPLFSVIIIAYNMAREVPRVVQSFLPGYQQGVEPDDIEIIVMENGSSVPIPQDIVNSWPKNVRYINVTDPKPSPAQALNDAVALASAPWVCPVIDGARMVSSGLFKRAKELIQTHPNPFIATLGFHLGDMVQQFNIANGYNQQVEDQLLQSIDWPNEPYRLFDISCLGQSAALAWLAPVAESNAPILKKSFYQDLGGFDTGFDIPGGGLVNLDFFKRAVEHADSQYVLLLDEASFHQYHGGVTTSRPVSAPSLEHEGRTTWDVYADQYQRLRGFAYAKPQTAPLLYGELRPEVQRILFEAVAAAQSEG